MKLTEIVAAIQKSGLENAGEVAQALTDYVDSLNSSHDTVVNRLNSQLETLTKAVGVETGTNEERLKAASTAIQSLTAERDRLVKEQEDLTKQIAKSQKQQLIRDAAAVGQASPVVLEKLISDEEIKTEGEKVLVGEKPLKEWAEANHPAFMAALFPTENTTNKLPSTPPHKKADGRKQEVEEDGQPKSVADEYMSKHYKVPEFLK